MQSHPTPIPESVFLEEIILGSGQNFVLEVQIGYLSSNVGSSTELKESRALFKCCNRTRGGDAKTLDPRWRLLLA
ncbi:hypothetical protein ACSBR2_042727 [Camellia fascicularis]